MDLRNNNGALGRALSVGLRLALLPALFLAMTSAARANSPVGTWAEKIGDDKRTIGMALRLNPNYLAEMAIVDTRKKSVSISSGRWTDRGVEVYVEFDRVDGRNARQGVLFVRSGEQLSISSWDYYGYRRDYVSLTRVSDKPLGVLAGTVTYQQNRPLSASAVVVMRLIDLTASDSQLQVVATKRIENPKPKPIQFIMTYDRLALDPSHDYAVMGEIEENGKVIFTQPRSDLKVVSGKPTKLFLSLKPAG